MIAAQLRPMPPPPLWALADVIDLAPLGIPFAVAALGRAILLAQEPRP